MFLAKILPNFWQRRLEKPLSFNFFIVYLLADSQWVYWGAKHQSQHKTAWFVVKAGLNLSTNGLYSNETNCANCSEYFQQLHSFGHNCFNWSNCMVTQLWKMSPQKPRSGSAFYYISPNLCSVHKSLSLIGKPRTSKHRSGQV